MRTEERIRKDAQQLVSDIEETEIDLCKMRTKLRQYKRDLIEVLGCDEDELPDTGDIVTEWEEILGGIT